MATIEGWIPKAEDDRPPYGGIAGSISLEELEAEDADGMAYIPIDNVDANSVLTIGSVDLGKRTGTLTKNSIEYSYWSIQKSDWTTFISQALPSSKGAPVYYQVPFDCTIAIDDDFELWFECGEKSGDFFHHYEK